MIKAKKGTAIYSRRYGFDYNDIYVRGREALEAETAAAAEEEEPPETSTKEFSPEELEAVPLTAHRSGWEGAVWDPKSQKTKKIYARTREAAARKFLITYQKLQGRRYIPIKTVKKELEGRKVIFTDVVRQALIHIRKIGKTNKWTGTIYGLDAQGKQKKYSIGKWDTREEAAQAWVQRYEKVLGFPFVPELHNLMKMQTGEGDIPALPQKRIWPRWQEEMLRIVSQGKRSDAWSKFVRFGQKQLGQIQVVQKVPGSHEELIQRLSEGWLAQHGGLVVDYGLSDQQPLATEEQAKTSIGEIKYAELKRQNQSAVIAGETRFWTPRHGAGGGQPITFQILLYSDGLDKPWVLAEEMAHAAFHYVQARARATASNFFVIQEVAGEGPITPV